MRFIVTCAAVAAMLAFGGCTKQPETVSTGGECKIDGVIAPKWICIPEGPEGTIGGLGTAPRNPAGNYGFQLDQAKAGGIDAITRTVEVTVQNMFKSWQRSTAQGSDAATFENDFETVSRQTAQQSLRGAKIADSWQHPATGVLYILMTAPIDQAQEALMSSLHNQTALWQQFQSQKAQEELKAEFQKSLP